MSEYTISEIRSDDTRGKKKQEALLIKEGISLDGNLDYSIGMYDDDYNMVATGSCFKNTLRCMAVSSDHQGEGLLNAVVTRLIEHQHETGSYNLFLYTKCDSAKFFHDLGFYEIARVEGKLVFMENRRNGFSSYLENLEKSAVEKEKVAAIVMNANPFTLGHRYLVEKASRENDIVHLFVVSEDVSLVPFDVRYRLVKEGTAHLDNIIYHESGDYIISNATFPSYFLKDSNLVITSHARLDIAVFAKIARALKINRRYFGEEPFSKVTGIYNEIMQADLPGEGVECVMVPRLESKNTAISASAVRKAISASELDSIKELIPESTYNYFKSDEAAPVIEAIKKASDVVHY